MPHEFDFEIHLENDPDVQVFADAEAAVQIVVDEEEAAVQPEPDTVPAPESASDVEIPQDFDPLEFEPLASPPDLPWLVGKVDGKAVWVDPSQYIGIATDHGLLSGLADDDHLMYLHKKAYGGQASQLPSHLHTSDDDGGLISVPPSAPPDPSFVTLGLAPGLTGERVLTAGSGISITDLGANSTVTIAAVAGGIDHGGLAGLLDDDHTQYVLRSVLTTNGDLPYRAAGVWSRLAIGSANQILGVDTGLPAWKAQSYIDHGSVSGLSDDDHSLYALASHAFAVVGAVPARLTGGRRLVAGSNISLTDGGAGGDLTIAATGLAFSFLDLTDTPNSYTGMAGRFVRVKNDESGLDFLTALDDFDQYDPRRAPSSPSAYDDEFTDQSLAAAWNTANSGSATHTISETARKGFLHIQNIDGGAGSQTAVYKAYTPGANAFTVAARVFGTVQDAGSNQCNLELYDGSGNLIWGMGMLNGTQIIVKDSGGFRTYNRTYVTPNLGEIWFALLRDSSTNYQAYVSNDGNIWARLEGASRSGTIGRIYLLNASFSSTNSEGWWDFVRTFTSQTLDIGGQPSLLSGLTIATHAHTTSLDGGDLTGYIHNSLLTTTGDIMYASAANTPARLAASVPAANVLTVLGFANGDTVPAWKTVLDSTAPTTIAASDAASAGTSLVFAHRDHRHGAPATYPATMANPSGTIGLAAVNGSSTSAMRADGAPALSQAIAPTWTGRHIFSGSATITTGVDAYMNLTMTVTNNTGNAIALFGIQGAMVGNGESPIALLVRPFFTPSANINEAFGGSLAAFINPGSGVTVAEAVGFRGILASSTGTGAITNAVMIRADAFVNIGGPTPTNVIGIGVGAMSGGTNNYDMRFGTVDTTAAGIYYGRIPVLYNGIKKYLHVFSA